MAIPGMRKRAPEEEKKLRDEYEAQKKQELEQGKQAELEKELKSLENYLDLYHREPVADTQENIDFCYFEVGVLKKLLGKK